MYYLKERCFIAWGGNIELARAVSKSLVGQGYECIVGGEALDRSEADDTINNRVINQMRRASRAIVLAEGRLSDGSYLFRPNLMFEWGYLLGRLPKGSILVVLINTPRSGVASDLQGTFSEEIPSNITSSTEQARWISKKYIDSRINDRFDPIDVVYNWSYTRSFLEDQVHGRTAPNPEFFSKLLLTSFIPAVYSDDIGFLEKIVLKANENPQNSYSMTRILANGLVEYCKAATLSGDRDREVDFNEIKNTFSNTANSDDSYIRAIARNYMGKCLVRLAIRSKSADDRQRLLKFAIEDFKEAETQFERCGFGKYSLQLWLSFVYRHLSLTYFNLGATELAKAYCENAMESRQAIAVSLRGSFNNTARSSFEAEYYLSVVDYVLITSDKRLSAYEEIRSRKEAGDLSSRNLIWQKVIRNIDELEKD